MSHSEDSCTRKSICRTARAHNLELKFPRERDPGLMRQGGECHWWKQMPDTQEALGNRSLKCHIEVSLLGRGNGPKRRFLWSALSKSKHYNGSLQDSFRLWANIAIVRPQPCTQFAEQRLLNCQFFDRTVTLEETDLSVTSADKVVYLEVSQISSFFTPWNVMSALRNDCSWTPRSCKQTITGGL